jgi:hypothetical protein
MEVEYVMALWSDKENCLAQEVLDGSRCYEDGAVSYYVNKRSTIRIGLQRRRF